ncbi:MAG TPA: enolase C-terminal domain-like protein [Candidatus Tectomicrobia bacterium]|nr:enolase C-terminal domain-like protein [Candidatus Tectomicrobia bacterium]
MKITDVQLTLFAWDAIPTTRYGRHTGTFGGTSQLGLLTVSTDQGVQGHAFLGSAMRSAHHDGPSLIQYLKPIVVGQDPLERERLYQALMQRIRNTTYRAIGAVDVALWDIGGKVAGLPIHRLLGSCRDRVRAYASSAVLPSKDAYAEEAARFQSDGWTAYKIHPPTDPATDIEVCRAVRRAVGDGFTLMLDSTWAYQYPEALRVGRVVEELGYHWYEDPLADDDLLSYVKLKRHLRIPILATEYTPGGLTAFAPWLVHQATDFLRGDVAVKGGITALVKAAHLAEAFHMNFEIHHGGNSLNNVANLHVTMAIKNCEFFEVLLPAGAQKYGLAQDIEVDRQGLVHAFDGPGLGAAIDFELIQRKKTAVLA